MNGAFTSPVDLLQRMDYRRGRALGAYPDAVPISTEELAAAYEEMRTASNARRLLLRRWLQANLTLLAFAGTHDDSVAWPMVVEWRAARAALGAAQ